MTLLLEHKSYVEPHVIFQLLDYLSSGYRKQIKENKKSGAHYTYPVLPR
ncbi:MAG: Rpn family recombination-promoting nuclease/putative transposase [Leadbetterella sp.]|nr:Rpn family recombination-promoting nuclease/putative transposase [Leadbetterella sp.]